MMEREKGFRSVRSFVRRQGRLTAAQQQALDSHWEKFGIDYADELLDLTRNFGNDQPVVLEIGFGNGESLAAMAASNPQFNYLGIEVHTPGVGNILQRVADLELTNIRVIRDDAARVVTQMLPDQSLSGLHLFFPDPWHKKRHQKRRLVQSEWLDLIAQKLKPGGFVHMATDWQHYAEHMVRTLSSHDAFLNAFADTLYAPAQHQRPETKYERRGKRLGHNVWDLYFTRR